MRLLPALLFLSFAPAPVLAQSRGLVGDLVPSGLTRPSLLGLEPWQWIGLVVAIVASTVLAFTIGRAGAAVASRTGNRRPAIGRAALQLRGPIQAGLALGTFGLLAVLLHLPDGVMGLPVNVYEVAWALTGGWLFVRVVDVLAERVAERASRIEGGRGRGIRTRIAILRRVAHVVGVAVLLAIALMQVGPVRDVGVSLLASAGVAGIVVGLAAQRTIGNLLAGIQLSFTQPLRVGDQVVIEKEFGTVEEINLSYVVVRIWDDRRLIVPMTRLLESPFENWTRVSTALIGEVKVPVDFETPIASLREEVERFVRAHPLFDRRTFAVQVTDMKDRSAELRVLVSAEDAGKLFDLRCATREFVLGYLQKLERGRFLPHVRVSDAAGAYDAETGAE